MVKKRVSYLKQGRDSKGRFTKKVEKKESGFMKRWRKFFYWVVKGCCCMFLVGCSRYQVVSEVDLHMYHMHNPKNNKVEVILTKEKLEIGKYYRLKSIKQVKVE